MSIDLSTDVGQFRLIVPDRDEANFVFTDDEVSAFISLEGDVRRAAALALETIASDNAMMLRYTQVLGLTVDGTRTSDALLKRAVALREQANQADDREGGAWDIATMDLDPFTRREILIDAALRGSA